jgi:MFS family permease
VSTFGAGTVFGVFFAGWGADYLGRKKTIAIGAVIALIAGIIQAATVHVGMLIAGRIIGGFAVGIMSQLPSLPCWCPHGADFCVQT